MDAVDRFAAQTLNKYCQANASAGHSATRLANLSVLQALLTSIPLAAADFLSLYASMLLTTQVIQKVFGSTGELIQPGTFLFVSLIILPVAKLAGLYPGLGLNPIVEFRQIAKSLWVSVLVLAGLGWFCFPAHWLTYVLSAAVAFALALPAAVSARFVARKLACRLPFWGVPVFILAEPKHAGELYRRLRTMADQGFRPVGVLLDAEQYWHSEQQLHRENVPVFDIRNTEESAVAHGVTWVIVSTCANREMTPALDPSLAAIPNRLLLSSANLEMGIWDRLYCVGATSGLRVGGVQPNSLKLLLKRALDLSLSLGTLLVGLPVWGLLYLLVRLSSPGAAFYGQRRIGRGGREFTAWKFRTMHTNADKVLADYLRANPAAQAEWAETHKLANDPRITRIGRLLRASSMDEIPQLWNVVLGQMSVVGPRPIVDCANYDASYITDYPNEYAAYKTVRPGLTGLWQVRCRNRGVYDLRIYWDMYYIRNWCIWLDLYVIMRTIKTVLFREGS